MKTIQVNNFKNAIVTNSSVEGVCRETGERCDLTRAQAEDVFGSVNPNPIYRAGWYMAGNQFSDAGFWTTNKDDECREG